MSPEGYDFLLNRAIDRQLTFEEARRRGVKLGEAQQQQLGAVRQQAIARGGSVPGEQTEDELTLEERDTEASMLQTELLARAGTPPPSPTAEDVERYYQAHQKELAALPTDPAARAAARAKIDLGIRGRLATEQQQAWADKLQELLDGLRADAELSYPAPP